MNREDIIRNLKYTMEKHKNDTVNTFDTNISAMCKDILDYLDQEPCEDAINREAVNTLVDELARAISDERCCISRGRSTATIMQDILDLSSVNPQPKTGQWVIKCIENGEITSCECSNCGSNPTYDFINSYEEMWIEKLPNYCPNCGVKMEGSQYKPRRYWRAKVMIDGHIETIYSIEYLKDFATKQILNVASHMAKERYILIKIEELHNE